MKGQIISGKFGEIVARQKNDEIVELGELLIAEVNTPRGLQKVMLQVTDIEYGAQLSQQNLELVSGMYLEEGQEITLYEQHLRTYKVAKIKALLEIENTHAKSAKTLPPLFTSLRNIDAKDITFLPQKGFSVGSLRSGSRVLDVPIFLDEQKVLSHHVLIPATTGKGKSNLMSVILWNLLESTKSAILVLDPHDEYYGRTQMGLKDHAKWNECGSYYTTSNPPPGALDLVVHLSQIQPKHFSGVISLSQPQSELLYAYYNKYGEDWIESLLAGEDVDHEFHEATIGVVQRRLAQLLDLAYTDKLVCRGVYSTTAGSSTLSDISRKLEQGKTVIIDTSALAGSSELLMSSLLTSHVFDNYRRYRKTGEKKPVVSIVLEEAPRVIGKEVLERGSNVFGTIAREGRKFNVGLCAITQLPSLIPKDILANMNTKVILGIEMAQERNAIIESAAQDLSDDSRTIASLDKGEAIITSNFARFATPVRIPLFSEIVMKSEKPKMKLGGL